jgi:hypothetical protein
MGARRFHTAAVSPLAGSVANAPTMSSWRLVRALLPTEPPTKPVSPHPALQVHMAEYTLLRQEVLSRMATQSQAFNYLLVVIGVAATALVNGLGKEQDAYLSIVLLVTILLPLVSAPLGFIFFDNEMVLHAIGSYIDRAWRPRTRELVADADILGNIWLFVGLDASSPRIHRRLSQGRWLLFLLPTVVPVLGLALFAAGEALGDGGRFLPMNTAVVTLHAYTRGLLWVALVLNAVLTGILLRGLLWAWRCPR